MNKNILSIVTSLISFLMLMQTPTQANNDSNINNNTAALTITVTSIDINDEALNLVYEIRNDSEDDAWILVGWYQFSDNTFGMAVGLRIAEDGHTLTIWARFNKPSSGGGVAPLYGRFVRLRPGDSQTESIFIRLPIIKTNFLKRF